MFDFRKYPSIENTYRSKTINQIQLHDFDKDEWVVLLKVHGCNFSIWTDGNTIKPAKRTSFIEDGLNFNNWQRIIAELDDNIKLAYKELTDKNDDQVVFWGELAGGDYPHPDVKKPDHSTKVQKGVFYAPFNFFYMFDISVNGIYIDHDTVVEIGRKYGIIVAEPLKRGSLADCLEYPNKFIDPLSKYFLLPDIETEKANICEGVVLKPVVPKFFGNGSRCILKNKNDDFKENNGEKKNKVPREKHEWSINGARLFSLIATYVSENRLRNVLSHGLVITQKDFGLLMKELNQDAWGDFIKDNDDDFDCLEKDEKKMIKKSLNNLTANLIRPNFMNIIDGEF